MPKAAVSRSLQFSASMKAKEVTMDSNSEGSRAYAYRARQSPATCSSLHGSSHCTLQRQSMCPMQLVDLSC